VQLRTWPSKWHIDSRKKKKKKSYFLSVDPPRIQFGKPHYNKLWLMQIVRIRNVPFHHILHGQ
jgi:hypothetical protein